MITSDFTELEEKALEIPEVKEYLESFSVVIGDLVLARRLQLGYTQSELAKLAGTTQARISLIEAGDEGVTLKTLDRVFKALKLTNIVPKFSEEAATQQSVFL